ncbi:hypothetical protein [Allostreptomyces psammosilenae]|uniref:Uncharacterized protein n=1 Tax=Allostreptomyces psammosilenae TaxID=1892865 RepID=A0A852ZWG8_9ACTN|nr:hypothetical protein [Allostreptomyces psammosilenae]NYI06559.1 hypothetical protein [Allostreptomyces psammosilenae]
MSRLQDVMRGGEPTPPSGGEGATGDASPGGSDIIAAMRGNGDGSRPDGDVATVLRALDDGGAPSASETITVAPWVLESCRQASAEIEGAFRAAAGKAEAETETASAELAGWASGGALTTVAERWSEKVNHLYATLVRVSDNFASTQGQYFAVDQGIADGMTPGVGG